MSGSPRVKLTNIISYPSLNYEYSKEREDEGFDISQTYLSPYLTCEECNSIVFIDSKKLRLNLYPVKTDNAGVKTFHSISPEAVPKCPECNRSIKLRIGADDLSFLQAETTSDLARKRRIQKIEIVKIQRAYRKYLAFRLAKAKLHFMLIKAMLKTRCASVIQAMFRMRMAKRKIKTKKYLRVIKYARPMLMERALNNNIHKQPVFWYDSREEIHVLNDDYYILVERLGHHPPLHIVEENLELIAKKILQREHQIVTRVQSKWRGIVVRRFNQVFQRELIRIRENMVQSAIKIQMIYRGILGRRTSRRIKINKWNYLIKQRYFEYRKKNNRSLIGAVGS